MRFHFDEQADALDIELEAGITSRTVQIDVGTLIDLDSRGRVLSIEVIRPARLWPLEEILEHYELDPDDAAVLTSLWSTGGPYPFGRADRELIPA
jgi:uncharacterized protein YuzE